MSGAAPTEDLTWAESAPGYGIVEPTTKRVAGWNPGDKPPAEWLNYWMRGVGRMRVYYGNKNVAGGIVGLHDTNVSAAWAATAASANALSVTGHGTGAGVVGAGGASGSGVVGSTTAGSAASAAGGFFTSSGSHGRAVWAIAGAGASGTGVFATAPSGTGQAIWAVGVSNSNAIWAQGPASGVALLAEGAGSYTLDVRNNRAATGAVIGRYLYTGSSAAATGHFVSVTASASGVGGVFEGATAAGTGVVASGFIGMSLSGAAAASSRGLTISTGAAAGAFGAVISAASAASGALQLTQSFGGSNTSYGLYINTSGGSTNGRALYIGDNNNAPAAQIDAFGSGAAAVVITHSGTLNGGVPLRLTPKATTAATGSYTPVAGDIYIDSTTNAIRYYVGGAWRSLTGA